MIFLPLITAILIFGVAFWARNRKKISQELWRILIGIIIMYLLTVYMGPEFANKHKTFFQDVPISSPAISKIPVTDKQVARIHFEQTRPFVDRAVLGKDQIPVYFFEVQIFNDSDDSSIRARYLKLTDLHKLDSSGIFRPWENAVPANLKWPRHISKKISPGEGVFVPFARIFPPKLQKVEDTLLSGNIEIPQLRFCVDIWDRRMTSHVPPGTHRFKLTAFFEDSPPAEAEFQLEWSGEQRENLDSRWPRILRSNG